MKLRDVNEILPNYHCGEEVPLLDNSFHEHQFNKNRGIK